MIKNKSNKKKTVLIVILAIVIFLVIIFGTKFLFNYMGCVGANYHKGFNCSAFSVSKTICQIAGYEWGPHPERVCFAPPCEFCLTGRDPDYAGQQERGKEEAKKAVERAKAKCLQGGGVWTPIDIPHAINGTCFMHTSDAGKSCTDHDQCESECVVDKMEAFNPGVQGKCAGEIDPLCKSKFRDGVFIEIVCD